MQHVLGVDVGGTKILIGIVNPDGSISSERRYAAQRGTQAAAVAAVSDAISAYWDDMILSGKVARPGAIGMGLVGQVDFRKGVWVHSLATPIAVPYPLGDVLTGKLGIPVYADNDVHCATLAELHFGIGRTVDDFVYLNIGTGIAAGLVSGGQLIRGHRNIAGEVGHIATSTDIRCKCGRYGCAEEFASGGGMLRYARSLFVQYPDSSLIALDQKGELFSNTIFIAARQGDALAVRIARLVLRTYLSIFQDLINLMDPQAIAVGGGVFRDKQLLPEIIKMLEPWLPQNNRELLSNITVSQLDPQKVGLIGAALCAYSAVGYM